MSIQTPPAEGEFYYEFTEQADTTRSGPRYVKAMDDQARLALGKFIIGELLRTPCRVVTCSIDQSTIDCEERRSLCSVSVRRHVYRLRVDAVTLPDTTRPLPSFLKSIKDEPSARLINELSRRFLARIRHPFKKAH